MKEILMVGIDPGKAGAFVVLGDQFFSYKLMLYKDKDFDFRGVRDTLQSIAMMAMKKKAGLHVVLERAVPMAQGAKSAFSYGRSFGMLEMVLDDWGKPITYVEPQKWAKVMHEGIDSRLKPKAKSVVAVERLYSQWLYDIPRTPKSGVMHEGVVDALLIAGYGMRTIYKRA